MHNDNGIKSKNAITLENQHSSSRVAAAAQQYNCHEI